MIRKDEMVMTKKKRVLLGMSGGVDSSVCAILLREMGYEVVGATLKLWQKETPNRVEKTCCSIDDVEDARKVCFEMGIDHYVLNMKKSFNEKVVQYFIDEYKKGRTPNPCIACNKHMKFSAMLQNAELLECDYVATGHYAQIEFNEATQLYHLKRAKDLKKDQSYVLNDLTQSALSKILFPLGGMTKDEVRKIANQHGITTAKKPDSQEICFVDKDYVSFIKENTEDPKTLPSPGSFVNTKGDYLGDHQGIIHYTVGQRKNLGINVGKKVYVKSIDAKRNLVILGEDNELYSKKLIAKGMHFVSVKDIKDGTPVLSKIRYNADLEPAIFRWAEPGVASIEFDEPQRAITPGQTVVCYQDDVVLAGGIIHEAL